MRPPIGGCDCQGTEGFAIGDIAIIRVSTDDSTLLDRVVEGVFNHPIDRARLVEYLAQPSTMLVVARDGEMVVGQVKAAQHWHPDKSADLYVDEVMVAPSHQRRGIARAMLAEVERWARERGCADIWLAADAENRGAQALYEGFAQSRLCRIYYWVL
jgi:aminoglycoside 6'-N-acetyltransferase I